LRAPEPALHIEHEAIPVGRSCGAAACPSPLPAALPGTPVVFGPDNAYLIEQSCWAGADVGPLFCGGIWSPSETIAACSTRLVGLLSRQTLWASRDDLAATSRPEGDEPRRLAGWELRSRL